MSEVGTAFLSIIPETRGFSRKLDSQVGGELDKSGKRAGTRFGAAFKTSVGVGLTAGVPSAPLFRVGPEELG